MVILVLYGSEFYLFQTLVLQCSKKSSEIFWKKSMEQNTMVSPPKQFLQKERVLGESWRSSTKFHQPLE